MSMIQEDLRYTLRTLRAKPGLSSIIVLSLGLGIGANTAIFSLWYGALHSSLPMVQKPEELAILSNPGLAGVWFNNTTGNRNWLTYAEFEQLRDHASSFSGIIASQSGLATWPLRFTGSELEQTQVRLVSGGYFRVLGVRPAAGRLFTTDDDQAAIPHAVISFSYWQRRFGGRADVVGRPFILRKVPMTVVGIAPEGFVGETVGQQPDLWVPLRMQPTLVPQVNWIVEAPPNKVMWLHVFGRLRPGVTLLHAESEVNAIFRNGLESFYGSLALSSRRDELLDQRIKIQPGAGGASEIRNNFSIALTVLVTAAAVLLFVVCANLANLLLSNAAERRPEIALKLSLGATRAQILRQLAAEILVLAGFGGLVGLGISFWLHIALRLVIAQVDSHFRMTFKINGPILLYTFAVTLASALLFGLWPAWQAANAEIGDVLKEQNRDAVGGSGRMRWSRGLVSLQLALCLPLLSSAGLLVRTLYNLQHVRLGYSPERLLLVRVDVGDLVQNEARRATLLLDLQDQLTRSPGVRSASFSELGLFPGNTFVSTLEVEGYVPKGSDDREALFDRVGPLYFATLGVPMTLGREFLQRDRAGTPNLCVINQAFAQRYFADRNPIGMHITSVLLNRRIPYQIVGVAKNAQTQNIRGQVEPRFFVAEEQNLLDATSPTFLIRTTGDDVPMLSVVRQALRRVDPSLLTVASFQTVEETLTSLTIRDRTIARFALVFGFLALTLAAIGLFGVLSHSITRRRGEIAVRIALGARPRRVIAMILIESEFLVISGLLIGAGFSYAESKLVRTLLFGVSPLDPLTITLSTALLLLVALGAAYLPARRASKSNPMVALRRQ